MLKTIHVEIDPTGHIHVLEPIPFKLEGRALLTLLESDTKERDATTAEIKGNASRALRLLYLPVFSIVQKPIRKKYNDAFPRFETNGTTTDESTSLS